jgi:hypothetical protein
MLSCSAKNRIVQLAKKKIQQFVDCASIEAHSGANSSYIQVTESFGVKFSNEDNMFDLYETQLQAYHIGLGPYCFSPFNFCGFTCYITETAQTIASCDDADESFGNENKYYHQAKRLQSLLRRKINFYFDDLHNANVAYVRNTMVCIDFGS